MIKIGVCANPDSILDVQRIGYDYIEGNLTALHNMTDDEFAALQKLVDSASIKVEAFNCMLPGTHRVTGPDVDAGQLNAFIGKAFARAKRLGGEVVVFGSSGARSVPEGFPVDAAWRQIVDFLRLAEVHCAEHGITLAIEPLRRQESNIINLVSEATALAAIVDLPHIRALGDTYHMALVSEPLSNLTLAGKLLAHTHTANPDGRVYPKKGDGEDYRAIFDALRAGGYDGRISVEGGTDDFAKDAPAALTILKEARN